MENILKHQEKQNPSFLPSPKSYSSNSSTSSANSATNGLHHHHHFPLPSSPKPQPTPPPPQSPLPITRSEPNNPYPTTFVQADTSSFKQVVQMLTGSSDTSKVVTASSPKPETFRNPIPPVRTIPKNQKSSSKLYERRNSLKNFKISPIGQPGLFHSKPGGFTTGSTRPGEILSPSILDFPSLALSPVTPLIPDPFNRSMTSYGKSNLVDMEAEEKAIAQKGFYLHPSPTSTPTDSKPRLLPLFPETSPRVAAVKMRMKSGGKSKESC
ncbi:hypothetical protein LIER_33737 [Lithospermum erythrorhizon]|uniref:VQ domain-containing protein n=1 Tax=Lithospermum erythrorhizon TaxID=34254 RepID=A0AAV3RZS4_LITER